MQAVNMKMVYDRKATYLKKATLEMDRSSRTVREEAKIDRKTAGVTGIVLSEGVGGLPAGALEVSLTFAAVTVGVEDVDADEGITLGVALLFNGGGGGMPRDGIWTRSCGL